MGTFGPALTPGDAAAATTGPAPATTGAAPVAAGAALAAAGTCQAAAGVVHPLAGGAVRLSADPAVRLCWCCGQPHRVVRLAAHSVARCTRCDAVLARGHRLSLDSLLALTLAAALLFGVAQTTEMVSVRLQGAPTFATFPGAVAATWRGGEPLVALAAAATAIVAPVLLIALRLYLLLPLVLAGRCPPAFVACLRVEHHLSRWSMVEVLTVGALVSIVRVAGLAQAVPGPGLYALCGTTLVLAAMQSAGARLLWERAP